MYFEYNTIFLVTLIDSIIYFCCLLHFLHFVFLFSIFYSFIFCSLYFVFYILKIAEKAE